MPTERDFIEVMEREPLPTVCLVYADWLEENGDWRAEGWRVLLEEQKWPDRFNARWYWWTASEPFADPQSILPDALVLGNPDVCRLAFRSFCRAMNAAVVAWVRVYRDPDFALSTENNPDRMHPLETNWATSL